MQRFLRGVPPVWGAQGQAAASRRKGLGTGPSPATVRPVHAPRLPGTPVLSRVSEGPAVDGVAGRGGEGGEELVAVLDGPSG